MIKVILTTDDKKHEGKGKSVFEALDSLNLTWEDIKLKGTIKVSEGKKYYEKYYPAMALRRIFAGKMGKIAQAKNLEWLLNNAHKKLEDKQIKKTAK